MIFEDSQLQYIIVAGVIVLVLYKFIIRKTKGVRGEIRVEKLLQQLNKDEYKVFNDIYLEIENRTTQIDHLIISTYGVFVIETKNYQGWIHGHEKSQYWTQSIYKTKIKFRNPIKQNWSHIFFLRDILQPIANPTFHPIIVFVGTATLKNVHSTVPVIYGNQLRAIIASYQKLQLSTEDIAIISNQIKHYEVKGQGKKKKHRKYVEQNILNRKKNINSLICPTCKGVLKIREGKFGKFYGCSNFPSCTYSKKI